MIAHVLLRREDGAESHADLFVRAVPLRARFTGTGDPGVGWACYAEWPSADRAALLTERVSDAPCATAEEAAEHVRLAAEGSEWRKPWCPAGHTRALLHAETLALVAASGIVDDRSDGTLYQVCRRAILDGEGTAEDVRRIWAEAARS